MKTFFVQFFCVFLPSLLNIFCFCSVQFSRSVMSDSLWPHDVAQQASLSITNSRSSLRIKSIESVMPSSHRILGRPLLLLSPNPPSIRVFSNESALHMRWPKYWSFRFSIIPSKISQGWSPSEWTGWISLQSRGLSRVFSRCRSGGLVFPSLSEFSSLLWSTQLMG